MKIELKDFQDDAVEQLIKKLNPAKREVADGGDHQAVILAAPTGSGKTVITAALIEEILMMRPQPCSSMAGVRFCWARAA